MSPMGKRFHALTAAMARSARVARGARAGALAVAGILAIAAGASAQALRPPQGGEVRALVIGIDAYQFVPPLQGAVADARDLETTLRRNGIKDVTALFDAAADRNTVMRSLDQLLERSRPGDLVILTIAGHGVQEPEHVKGSQPDGMDNVFVLAGFDPRTPAGTRQRIIGTEFNHVIKEFEARSVQVLFVADACYGGGMAREIDPRAGAMSYRQAPRYSLIIDDLRPISTPADAFLSGIDFRQTAFLAAVDRKTKAPEVRIPGVPGFRGALSYAVARAMDGAADENQDGVVTQQELFSYVRQVAYQLSDERQNVVTTGPSERNSQAVFAHSRAVVLMDAADTVAARPQIQPARAGASIGRAVVVLDAVEPADPPAQKPPAQPAAPTSSSPVAAAGRPGTSGSASAALASTPLSPVRVAVFGNRRDLLANLDAREARFEIVATMDNPDLVWDPASRDVLAGADVVARGIDRTDLPSVIDRLAAVNGFKRLATQGPQSVRVLPNDGLHRRDDRIDVQVSGVAQRSLLMFNIAGDGTVQTLYPIGSDPAVIATADYKFKVRVGEPFGADQVVAVTSSQPLGDLEQALKTMNQRRTAVEVYRTIEALAPPDARIGAAGIYTAP